MIIVILEKVPKSLRGELTRWLIEPKTGVFVGSVSAMVREKLWEKCEKKIKQTGGMILLWPGTNEQRFNIRIAGDTSRRVVDCEGLQLIEVPIKRKKTKPKQEAVSVVPNLETF